MSAVFTIACASNSDAILSANLAASPLIADGVRLHVERNAPSAAIAYNRALESTDDEIRWSPPMMKSWCSPIMMSFCQKVGMRCWHGVWPI